MSEIERDDLTNFEKVDENTIRNAIDRLQREHPAHFAYDPTRLVSVGSAGAIQSAIDRIAQRMTEDSEIHIICEMAKMYLDGARPSVEPQEKPHGMCGQCRYYGGVRDVGGHAPCSFWNIGGVLSGDYCSRFDRWW